MKEGDTVYSTCGEVFNYDQIDFDIGDSYYSGTVVEVKPESLVGKWTVDRILEQMDESLFEEVGEVAEDSLDLSQEKKDELFELIKNFMRDNASVTCYKVEDIKEHIVTIEDIS